MARYLQLSAAAAPRRWPRIDLLPLLWVALAVVLLFLVVNPLFRLVQISLQDTDTGAFTLHNYLAAYGRARYAQALWNSLALGALVTALCLVFAVPIAWGVSRRLKEDVRPTEIVGAALVLAGAVAVLV